MNPKRPGANEPHRNFIEEFYKEKFSFDDTFQKLYQEERMVLYEQILKIIKEIKISSVLDVGCSFGLLVERCNLEGIDAYGLDLPVDNLKKYHQNLPHSQGKFLYGSINDGAFLETIGFKDSGALILLDTLRFIVHPENLAILNYKYIIIREVSNNFYIARLRKKQKDDIDVKLYSPLECLKLFHNYYPFQIRFYHYSKNLNLPTKWGLFFINAIFPSYTLVLKRDDI